MNRKKWEGAAYSNAYWFAKLGEEFGEVADEQVKAMEKGDDYDDKTMIEELEHVEFIARCFRQDLERNHGR